VPWLEAQVEPSGILQRLIKGLTQGSKIAELAMRLPLF
jgi:hypothetical protein